MMFRLILMIAVLFIMFYTALSLLTTRGYLTQKRLKVWRRVSALTCVSLLCVAVAFSMFASVDSL